MKYLYLSVLVSVLFGPYAHSDNWGDNLCYSEELFIFYASKETGVNFSAPERRFFVENESKDMIEQYRGLGDLKSVQGYYLTLDELQKVCQRLDPDEFRKLLFFIHFMEEGTKESLKTEFSATEQ